MTASYLFIDDDVSSVDGAPSAAGGDAEAYSRALVGASEGRLAITPFKPGKLADVLREISEFDPDGLILDVSFVNAGEDAIAYDGITLAQQVRTLQTRSRLKNFPVVRLSKRDVVREYVAGDTTSDDLFDVCLEKEEVSGHRQETVATLLSLAADYPALEKLAGGERPPGAVAELLGLDEERLAQIDPRSLLGLQRQAPVHNLAQYISAALLRRSGILVDEGLLAIRLGVDIANSPGWTKVKAALSEAEYRGVFSQAYPRFWMFAVSEWWAEKCDKSLKRTEAPDRVKLLASHFGLTDLSPIPDNADSPGRGYWHRCVETGLPVDPSEGFPLIDPMGHEPWHDTDYICREQAMRHARTHKRLRPAERQRALSARPKR